MALDKDTYPQNTGADPGFLERGFICKKGVGVRFADFIYFFFFYKISHENEMIWSQ